MPGKAGRRLSMLLASSALALLALGNCGPSPAHTAAPTGTDSPIAATEPTGTAQPTPAAQVTETTMPTSRSATGSLTQGSLAAAALGRALAYGVYLPADYETSGLRYPVIYLLHGRGDDLTSWAHIKPDLDELVAAGRLPPLIAIMPGATSSQGGHYFVDSEYTGAGAAGERVETAIVQELIPHVDATYRTLADRAARAVAGYSMGGYGATRYVLAHAGTFSAAIVLSPAVYVPLPPADSSAREFGAFGQGDSIFVPEVYQAKNYPALLVTFASQDHSIRVFIAVGDDEYRNPDPAEAMHDIDMAAHLLFNQLVRQPKIAAELRVLDGGHDWDVWTPAFREGVQWVSRFLRAPE